MNVAFQGKMELKSQNLPRIELANAIGRPNTSSSAGMPSAVYDLIPNIVSIN